MVGSIPRSTVDRYIWGCMGIYGDRWDTFIYMGIDRYMGIYIYIHIYIYIYGDIWASPGTTPPLY